MGTVANLLSPGTTVPVLSGGAIDTSRAGTFTCKVGATDNGTKRTTSSVTYIIK